MKKDTHIVQAPDRNQRLQDWIKPFLTGATRFLEKNGIDPKSPIQYVRMTDSKRGDKIFHALQVLRYAELALFHKDRNHLQSSATATGEMVCHAYMSSIPELLASAKAAANKERMKGLVDINAAKERAKNRSIEIAGELWKADKDQVIRINDMAHNVWCKLCDEGFTQALPDSHTGLKNWIKSAAPDYARVGGRPRKTP